ncbi:MAG: prepilin peptidase [Elusimicrobiota bacterium]
MLEILIFITGLCIGSFLNVVIYRNIKEISIIYPPSFCPKCKIPIKWYDNIPIVSYIILNGRCRNCQEKISIEYPMIELISGIITLVFYMKWGSENFLWFLSATFISYVLIIISVIDFKTMMLSDLFSYIIAFIGVMSCFINPLYNGYFLNRLISCFSGIVMGAGVVYLLLIIGKIIYKKEAMGEGDIFLLGSIGSIVGVKGVIDVIIIASFIGAFYGILLILFKKISRFSYIPFGPFLASGCLIKIYFNINTLNLF